MYNCVQENILLNEWIELKDKWKILTWLFFITVSHVTYLSVWVLIFLGKYGVEININEV